MKNFIKHFHDLSKKDVKIAGGKGASLGEMSKHFVGHVPAGFVVTADAYQHFISSSTIEAEIKAEFAKVNAEDINSVEGASVRLRTLIESEEMPQEIAREITAAFGQLKAKFVAVRSSATAEDSKIASFAGELDSFLYTTEKELLNNVRKCWGSLFTPRAIFYRFEKKLHGADIAVAVVVQKMIASRVSGIAFTVHPVTQDKNQMIIEAAWGLGEAIVGGMVTPDSYVVRKSQNSNLKSKNILEIHQSEQEKKIVHAPKGGTKEVKVPAGERTARKLSDEQVLKIAQLCQKVEEHYKMPMDIEFALDDEGNIWLLQARPITTL